MNGRITIGQYYPSGSKIHNIDARVKLIGTFLYITVLFFANNVLGYLVSFAFLSYVILSSKVPPRMFLRGLRSIFFIIIFTFIINVFMTPGNNILFKIGPLKATLEGLIMATKLSIRLAMLVMASSVLTLTTSAIELTDALEYILKPLKKIKVPSHEIAMMMTITLRFIPILTDEMEKIMKAQKARGAELDTGNLIEKAKSLIPVLVPLFLSSFRRAEDLAIAMEARCYRGDINRTKMKVSCMKKTDYYAIIVLVLFTVSVILSRFWGNA